MIFWAVVFPYLFSATAGTIGLAGVSKCLSQCQIHIRKLPATVYRSPRQFISFGLPSSSADSSATALNTLCGARVALSLPSSPLPSTFLSDTKGPNFIKNFHFQPNVCPAREVILTNNAARDEAQASLRSMQSLRSAFLGNILSHLSEKHEKRRDGTG